MRLAPSVFSFTSWREREFTCLPISRIQLMRHTSAGRSASCTDLVGCVSLLDVHQAGCAGILPGFNAPQRGWIYRWTGPEAFWGMPGASGLRPCAWTHLKNALCHTRPVGGMAFTNTAFVPTMAVAKVDTLY